MEGIGLIIKTERLRQGMKQITLSRGICTPSYLSKVENNITLPSEEIITLLLKRLDIEIKFKFMDIDNPLPDILYLYKEAIINRNKNDHAKRLRFYIDNEFNFKNESDFFTFKLIQFRFCLILDETKMIIPLIEILESMKKKFSMSQDFLFNLNCGLYFYLKGDFTKALSFLESNLGSINKFPSESWELSDFYYSISVSYLMNNQSYNTLNYAQLSLRICLDNHFFERAIDSYIVVALAQKRNQQYIQAEETFKLAQQLALKFNLEDSIGRINQNLGSLFSIQGKSEKAIEYYTLSMENKRGTESYLISIHSIVQEYSKREEINQVVEWCQKGLFEIEKSFTTSSYQQYFYHFSIYLFLHSQKDSFEKTAKIAIQYFEDKNDYRHAHKYALLLANYLFKKTNYKEAAIYFTKSNEFLFFQKSIKNWEDL